MSKSANSLTAPTTDEVEVTVISRTPPCADEMEGTSAPS